MSIFKTVSGFRTPRTKFNLSHEVKTTLDMGKLVPVMHPKPVLPGDSWRVATEQMLRFAPMIAPMFHRVNSYVHFFFVPNRLVWEDWEDFITGGRDGLQQPEMPTIRWNEANRDKFLTATLSDYLGIPHAGLIPHNSETLLSALPYRGYQLIFQEYFQDQNLSEELNMSLKSGEVTDPDQLDILTTLRNRAWEKDYLTSCLPWAQRGANTIGIPGEPNYKDVSTAHTSNGDLANTNDTIDHNSLGNLMVTGPGGNQTGRIENIESMDVDINDLRKSVRLQEWLERQARGGSRYIESILSHFGVQSPDARLQRPEYLGGGKTPVVVSEVLNTTGDTGAGSPVPQGEMSGHGIAVGATNRFKRRFTEHGYIFALCSVMPKTAYSQGIERHWHYKDKFDFYWPEFANLGEQEVKNQEVYYDYWNPAANNEGTFGYQSRYAEYKFAFDSFHSSFRRQAGLDFWHMGRIWDSMPALNEQFVTADPTKRIFAVDHQGANDSVWCQFYHNISAIRPMPRFGTPRL